MKTKIVKSNGISGTIRLAGDKSISHRAALFAALATGQSSIENFLDAGVTRVLLNNLTKLGVTWQMAGNTLTVEGNGIGGLKEPTDVLFCGNSATTLRLLAGVIAAAGLDATLDGSDGLRKRPMKRIIEPLHSMGVPLKGSDSNTAPLKFQKRSLFDPLEGQNISLNVASAQVKTCVLLAGLGANTPIIVNEPAQSRDHTERLLKLIGAAITVDEANHSIRLIIPDEIMLNPLDLTIPGDISSAAFLIVAALIIPNSSLRIENVGLNPTRTGLLDVLIEMGGQISILDERVENNEPVGTIEVRSSELVGIEIDGDTIVRMIDEFPIFAIAAVCSEGKTTVRDATELRYKETDRISVLSGELLNLGVDIEEKPGGFIIEGGKGISGGECNGHGDHRLAMSLSILGTVSEQPIIVKGTGIIKESFPNFFELLTSLGVDSINLYE
ncbi:MAG: 3-phosphoshikimate 1-carboxyvinyltransferase [Chloroflexi bacterium]|jgi:3-phosphoshikimate 1-carboxyvinyltransferase|nr:3-phosphoshikimate 1-carboxyvinyltransferase [Chloroflexota bacterium]MBT4003787.1 3-phosphoshikimate 1-carboxyvinyltransferase [Chloroflexota bacterium]MBT4305689.1 3-phosphoshikimate 1-carboxyvinyltransferase [Chloroflexota bacterium]MBT4533513.1 3-phosphoshikimate 1-carboxyvinyltransferase [Chloroflexota bacterium]MBT4681844.1 3-phosphoshikimate 1-carboxyvinyltransferase [Chloroflexota bacterium]